MSRLWMRAIRVIWLTSFNEDDTLLLASFDRPLQFFSQVADAGTSYEMEGYICFLFRAV